MTERPGTASVKIRNKDDVLVDATILLYFELPKYNKEYAVYTYGEKSESGLDVNYVSTVVKTKNEILFNPIETTEEWQKIKEVMKSVIKLNRE